MNKEELCDILFKWLLSFQVDRGFKTPEDLSDGVVLAHILYQIAPDWFPGQWLEKIKPDANDNWRLKVSNLKKVLSKILDYYQECFGQTLSSTVLPDVVKIGDGSKKAELGKLLQLVLGCAVNCENKQEYIGRIMCMDEMEQRVMMECIQELDSVGALSFSASLSFDNTHFEQLVTQLNASNLAKEKAELRANELDLLVATLQDEKRVLVEDKKKLLEEIHSKYELTGSGPLRRQVESLKEEIFKLETSRDDYRIKMEHQDKQMIELQTKLDELARSAQEARSLKDELDILRETADKVEKYEAAIESYKKKLEEVGDIKRELKQAESKVKEYMLANLELEEELKKSSGLKAQVEAYKNEASELHDRLNEETKRADRFQFEVMSLSEKLKTVTSEKERLTLDRDRLREVNEELKCAQQLASTTSGEDLKLTGPESTEGVLVSNTELRQKLTRLEHENQMLKFNNKDIEDKTVLQNLLDSSKAQTDKMWKENREAHQRIMQLEGELKEIRDNGVDNKINDLQQQMVRERNKYLSELEEKEVALTESKEVIAMMSEKLSRKEVELQEAEEKRKKNVEKARNVIKSIDPNIDLGEILSLRNQIAEMQREIKEREKQMVDMKKQHELEEKAMTTAFHGLATKKNREAVDNRLASLGHGQSFLSTQRQPVALRVTNLNSK